MCLFFKKSKGSITVFVTLILVPTVFFTSFLVDLARIKLYSNQAVMTADNYGETVLTYYDNVLKELYGLFSVTQNKKALKELDTLKGYMESSFNPNNQGIDWSHLEEMRNYVNEKSGNSSDYNGFMPYSNAEMEMSYTVVDGANLGTSEILSSQIGDFMKFRIVQCIGDEGNDILDALDAVQKCESDAEAIEKRTEIAEAAEELFEAAELYYDELKKFAAYPDYLSDVSGAVAGFKTAYAGIISSDEYKAYAALMEIGESEGRAASEEVSDYEDEVANLKQGEAAPSAPDDETYEKAEIYDTWEGLKPGSSADELKKNYDAAVKKIVDARDFGDITFDLFPVVLEKLTDSAGSVKEKCNKLKVLNEEMNEILNDENVSDTVKDGIKKDLEQLDKIVSHVDTYPKIDDYIDSNSSINSEFKEQIDTFVENLEDYKNICFVPGAADTKMELNGSRLLDNAELRTDSYRNFIDVNEYKAVYDSLESCFGADSNEDADIYTTKKETAEKNLEDLEESLTNDSEESEARDIPEAFGYGTNGTGSGFSLTKMMKDAAKLFSANSMEQEGEKLLLKFYMVEYDFGMFSSRVTPEMKNASGEKEAKESLTGYE
ncbi:MAG: hypothetical protein LUG83_06215, partial [Lachnospiraceae bacterium]|nr:hypothetical protein [Lachnospiraceae bacterium]